MLMTVKNSLTITIAKTCETKQYKHGTAKIQYILLNER